MIITVCGGGDTNLNDDANAMELGRRIAEAGHILKNGGYEGTMMAVARGARMAGGHTTGVTVKGNLLAYDKRPNEYEEGILVFDTLQDRLMELLNTDAVIVLKGRLGTLQELFTVWEESIVKEIYGKKPTPVYVLGKENGKLIKFLEENDYVKKEHLKFINLVDSIDDLEFLRPGARD